MRSLAFALLLWIDEGAMHIYSNGIHCINIRDSSSKIGQIIQIQLLRELGFHPICDFGYLKIIDVFSDNMSPHTKTLLQKYFDENEGPINRN